MSHAILSPSSSSRWIQCPPSARLQLKFKDEVSTYAKEGTDAHSLCEFKLKSLLGQEAKDPREDLNFLSKEMEECSDGYVAYVLEIVEASQNPMIYIEEKLDLSSFIPEASGTADCLIVSDENLHVIDYKHGMSVEVDAKENTQLMIYALGALYLFDGIYDTKTVILHIYQPRRDNISVFTISKTDLYKWSKEVLEPRAKIAFKGEGDFKAGAHCRFCKAKNNCRKRAELSMGILKHDFKKPDLLEDYELEEVLKLIPLMETWANDVKDYALEKALQGKKWTDFKLVEGRSTRKYADEEKIAEIVTAMGFDPYEKKLLGITKMTKLLGKKNFDENLSAYITKPQGKPTLVERSDKREEIANIKDEFMKETDND